LPTIGPFPVTWQTRAMFNSYKRFPDLEKTKVYLKK